MDKKIIPAGNRDALPSGQTPLAETQQNYLHQATANNTRRAYQSAIRQFEVQGGLLPATEQTIAQYITKRAANLNPRTLALHLALGYGTCDQPPLVFIEHSYVDGSAIKALITYRGLIYDKNMNNVTLFCLMY